jgi:ADP-heptose:LPS heptosyltransferase
VREAGLIEDLGSRHFDAAVIFTSFSQSPYPPAYVCYLAGIPLRLGHSKEFGGGILSECGKPPPDSGHQVDRNLALIELAGLPTGSRQLELFIPDAVQIKTDRLLQDNDVEPLAPFILLAPGASCAARRYDPALYACVARDLAALSGLPIVVVGSEREAGILSPLVELAAKGSKSNIHSLVGQTSVPELAALICRARLVIANNSASLHIADAFLRPMVILYSGTEYESQWAPRFAPAQLLRRETYCSPCYNFCCPYHMECLDIPPEEVLDAALHLLANQLKEGKQPAGVMFDERKDEKPS